MTTFDCKIPNRFKDFPGWANCMIKSFEEEVSFLEGLLKAGNCEDDERTKKSIEIYKRKIETMKGRLEKYLEEHKNE